uniref:Uncharacterized protein n=1 Tax=Rousettus aegyptiacus TaxID=9407 RepID=A0A7J8E8A0_ROUAE|nr:hypothetical protein HJG63_008092 [Rousettus aegyptiacus]
MLQATWHTRAFTRPGREGLDTPRPPGWAVGRGRGRAAGDWSQRRSFRSPDLVADFRQWPTTFSVRILLTASQYPLSPLREQRNPLWKTGWPKRRRWKSIEGASGASLKAVRRPLCPLPFLSS